HQDAAMRICRSAFAGVTLDGRKLESAINLAYQRLGVEPAREVEPRPWSIRLANDNPIEFKFDKDHVEFVVRGDSFTFGAANYSAQAIAFGLAKQNTARG